MIKIAITGKADKRILAYPLMRACSISGHTSVVTDDAAYKRLYAGKENYGEIEDIKINVLFELTDETLKGIEEQAVIDETEYLIVISDSYYPKDADHILMLCEQNCTFLGNYIEDIIDNQNNNVTFGTLTLFPHKIKAFVPKEVHMHQITWKPEHSMYLFQVEEMRQLQPLKDKFITALLVNAFAAPLNIKPASLNSLLKRKRYAYMKKDNRKEA
ncbi:hypothetical protein QA584_08240 [Anaerocolumna sp. AGMB13025]|uniref:hypothetical protein n=1 Tax=Anaerocolumna sp. AGMB13025 TaxID=3039116 RepID=UPI00241DD81C|nr:hypothetical protein [Anaerocolumna sp. AGMB13025]WFR59060.1 hypothetical protein QA584_08240 [Anaerocolumna sp. AGMB13025]